MEDDEKSRKLKQAIDILSSIPSSSASDRAVGRTNGGSGASSAAGPSRYRGTHNFGLFHLIPMPPPPPPLPVEESLPRVHNIGVEPESKLDARYPETYFLFSYLKLQGEYCISARDVFSRVRRTSENAPCIVLHVNIHCIGQKSNFQCFLKESCRNLIL